MKWLSIKLIPQFNLYIKKVIRELLLSISPFLFFSQQVFILIQYMHQWVCVCGKKETFVQHILYISLRYICALFNFTLQNNCDSSLFLSPFYRYENGRTKNLLTVTKILKNENQSSVFQYSIRKWAQFTNSVLSDNTLCSLFLWL